MGSRLLCGTNTAYLTTKCGQSRLCELTNASEIRWGRRLDDFSEAQITVLIGGNEAKACCDCLGDLEPWCSEVHIVREGEVVWLGPIVKVKYHWDRVIVTARDVSAWLEKRVPEIIFDNRGDPTGMLLNDIAYQIILQAMSEDDSPCILNNLVFVSDPLDEGTGRRVYPAFVSTALEYLKSLAETGMDWRVIGRSIILSGDELTTVRIGTLQAEHFVGDPGITVTKDGLLLANRWYVNRGDGAAVSAEDTASIQSCYGLHEDQLPDDHGIYDVANALDTAQDYVAATKSVPRILDVPAGVRLSADAPISLDQLIPGVRINVAITNLCFPIQQAFKLLEVNVVQTPEDESIAITLGAINQTGRI